LWGEKEIPYLWPKSLWLVLGTSLLEVGHAEDTIKNNGRKRQGELRG